MTAAVLSRRSWSWWSGVGWVCAMVSLIMKCMQQDESVLVVPVEVGIEGEGVEIAALRPREHALAHSCQRQDAVALQELDSRAAVGDAFLLGVPGEVGQRAPGGAQHSLSELHHVLARHVGVELPRHAHEPLLVVRPVQLPSSRQETRDVADASHLQRGVHLKRLHSRDVVGVVVGLELRERRAEGQLGAEAGVEGIEEGEGAVAAGGQYGVLERRDVGEAVGVELESVLEGEGGAVEEHELAVAVAHQQVAAPRAQRSQVRLFQPHAPLHLQAAQIPYPDAGVVAGRGQLVLGEQAERGQFGAPVGLDGFEILKHSNNINELGGAGWCCVAGDGAVSTVYYQGWNFPRRHSPSRLTLPSRWQCTPCPCGSPQQNSPANRSPFGRVISPMPCGRQLQAGPQQSMPFSKRMRSGPTATPSTNSPSSTRPPCRKMQPSPLTSFSDTTLSSNSSLSLLRSRCTTLRNRNVFSLSPLPGDERRFSAFFLLELLLASPAKSDFRRFISWGEVGDVGEAGRWMEAVRERMGKRKLVREGREGGGESAVRMLSMRLVVVAQLSIFRIWWLSSVCSPSSPQNHYYCRNSSIILQTSSSTLDIPLRLSLPSLLPSLSPYRIPFWIVGGLVRSRADIIKMRGVFNFGNLFEQSYISVLDVHAAHCRDL